MAKSIPAPDLAVVQEYCANRLPPQYRDEVRVECTQRGTSLTISECRPPWSAELGPEWTRQPVAQLRYEPTDGRWTLYFADRNSRWHRYPDALPSCHIESLLGEISTDPTGIFWG